MTSIPHLCIWNVTNLPGNAGTLQDYYTSCQKFKNLYHKDIKAEEEEVVVIVEEEVVSGIAKQKKCGLLYDAEHSLALKV